MLAKTRKHNSIQFFQIFYRFSTNSPHVSGDSIANCCDYYVHGRFGGRSIRLKKLIRAKSIFVNGHSLVSFLEKYGNIINPVVLVSGNSDQNFQSVPTLPTSVKLFLCQNLEINDDPVAHTLPIGLENLRLGRSGRTSFHKFQSFFTITDKILVPPMSPTNPIRELAIGQARLKPDLFDVPDQYMTAKEYFSLTRKYKFILTLEGNGYENHRVWEALYQGSIAIMLNTEWSRSLVEYGLPILFVNSIEELSSKMISQFADERGNFKPSELKALWIPFWSTAVESGELPQVSCEKTSNFNA